MHVLYVDESNTESGAAKYFILAGVAVYERQIYWLSKALSEIAAGYSGLAADGVELHATHIYGGKREWRKIAKADREQIIKNVLNVLGKPAMGGSRIFAAVVEKDAFIDMASAGEITEKTEMEHAFLQIISRFDYYLGRLYHRDRSNNQKGIVLFDKSSHEKALQALTGIYRDEGHRWGTAEENLRSARIHRF